MTRALEGCVWREGRGALGLQNGLWAEGRLQMTVPARICQVLASRLPGACAGACVCRGECVSVHACACLCTCCAWVCACWGARGYRRCSGHRQLSRGAPSARCPHTAPRGASGRAPSPGCSRGAPPRPCMLAAMPPCSELGDLLPVPGGDPQARWPCPGDQPGSRRQLCVPRGTAASALAWVLLGHGGVKAILGAEQQCTLPYLFPLSFNPLLPWQVRKGEGTSPTSAHRLSLRGYGGDAHPKSSFAKHPSGACPAACGSARCWGRPSWSPAPWSHLS